MPSALLSQAGPLCSGSAYASALCCDEVLPLRSGHRGTGQEMPVAWQGARSRGRQSWWPIWETIQPLATGLVLSQGAVRTEWHRGLGTGPGKGRTWCREVQELRVSAALSPRGRGAREGSRYQPGGAFGVGHHVIYVQIGTLPRVKAPLQPRWTAGELGVSHHLSAR